MDRSTPSDPKTSFIWNDLTISFSVQLLMFQVSVASSTSASSPTEVTRPSGPVSTSMNRTLPRVSSQWQKPVIVVATSPPVEW